ncbi:NAD-dependent epimerase/dehydratase family protein [Acinetobacter sp. ANC 4277]|uniref:NAD-dependent epimerase/dehydratase family protein n=1 Tax=Acinetobacter terrae TaxID=2731247 RepID=UPI00148F73BE|nr:NAD-dependent epimerase/dehydratase family protein [Acinetobacter terrae]NNG77215.1 NAD-dependent epimerase/dehydratase family protein [Acinetobacter terrae]
MTNAAKTVLITGSEGFTGKYMAAEMRSAGYHVVGLGTKSSTAVDYYQADLLSIAEITAVLNQVQPDIVIHLAAIAFVGHGDANAFYQVNLQGTRNLLAALAALDKTPEAVLLASSANVYGNTSEGVLSESTLPAPANDYAVSKLAMEYMARLWQDRLPIIITRPFNYTGVGQTENFLLPKIVAHFRRQANEIELGNLDVWRDFSDVRSVVNAYRCLIEAKAFGHIVNVCSGNVHSLREVVAMIEEVSGHHIDIRVNPAFVRVGEVKTLCGDAGLLRSLIGNWQTPPLQETLCWMLEAK